MAAGTACLPLFKLVQVTQCKPGASPLLQRGSVLNDKTFLLFFSSLWKKIACIPDPSAFFKPLYLMYNGDFKV